MQLYCKDGIVVAWHDDGQAIPDDAYPGMTRIVVPAGTALERDGKLWLVYTGVHRDALGEVIRIPGRFLTAEDELFKSVGYRMESGGKSIAIATDLGVYSDYTVQNLTGLDAVLLEANHDENMLAVGPYPYPLKQRIAGAKGHLSNLAAGHLLCEILHDNLQEVLLGHLSKENNYEALAFETVACEVTTGDNPYHSGDFHLAVAKRSEVSPLIEV